MRVKGKVLIIKGSCYSWIPGQFMYAIYLDRSLGVHFL